MGFLWICTTDNGDCSHSSNLTRRVATAPHAATTAATRTLHTDTGTALDDGRVPVHRPGDLSTVGSLVRSRPHRPPWRSYQRPIGVAGPRGLVCSGYWC